MFPCTSFICTVTSPKLLPSGTPFFCTPTPTQLYSLLLLFFFFDATTTCQRKLLSIYGTRNLCCIQLLELLTWTYKPCSSTEGSTGTKDDLKCSEIADLTKDREYRGRECLGKVADLRPPHEVAIEFCRLLVDVAYGVRSSVINSQSCKDSLNPQAALATSAGVLLLEKLLEACKEDPEYTLGLQPHDRAALRVRAWHAVSVLATFAQAKHTALDAKDIIGRLKQPEAPAVKQYQEAGAALHM